ncbi:hypothetical protein E5288_WYG001794 [Bos mutus]|uniref:Uncharacterized protein n=1 Tax=Bos mutus TaxID=72004 RepID=A0A6B0RR72_9CETA|nr:hypothetical protein [Bos mutus]
MRLLQGSSMTLDSGLSRSGSPLTQCPWQNRLTGSQIEEVEKSDCFSLTPLPTEQLLQGKSGAQLPGPGSSAASRGHPFLQETPFDTPPRIQLLRCRRAAPALFFSDHCVFSSRCVGDYGLAIRMAQGAGGLTMNTASCSGEVTPVEAVVQLDHDNLNR